MFELKDTQRDYYQYMGRKISRLLILSLLDHENEHSGYSLIKSILKLTEGKINFRAGTIYPQFEKLAEEGLIKKHIRESHTRSKDIIRQKAIYTITPEGIKVLTQMREEWTEFRQLIDKIGLWKNENDE